MTANSNQSLLASVPPAKKVKHSFMSDTDSSDDSENMNKSWLDSYLDLPASDWLCKIPINYISDEFNVVGIPIDKSHAKPAFQQLVGDSDSSDSFDSDTEDEIDNCTETLFGLIHARFIFTPEGIQMMKLKYAKGLFGICPRYKCKGEKLLPVGLTDHPNVCNAKVYCPKCHQLYEPDPIHASLDGAYFTVSFPHFFILELKHKSPLEDHPPTGKSFETSVVTSESQYGRFLR